jgi:ubiquinone biosynthesis protein
MNVSPKHLKRYKDIALLLWKYGRSDLVRQMGIDDALASEAPATSTEIGPGAFRPSRPAP